MMAKKPKILYIEDDLLNRILVRRVLEAHGYTVLEAEDGLSGIEMAREELPGLILMDTTIPGLDGFATTTKLKSIEGLKNTPIVALTAEVIEGDREMALTAGCDGYIQKPIEVDRLPTQIADFLIGKRERVTIAEERDYLRKYSQKLVDRLHETITELTAEREQKQKSYQAIKRKFNPYISGGPVREPDMFFGREEALAEVLDTIHNNHVAIYGERRIGKTSLLHQLDTRLREMEDPQYLFIPAFVNLQGVPAERLFYTLMSAIARSCQARVGPLNLIYATKKEGYDDYDLMDDLEMVLEALAATTDKQIRLVLLLDEGDELNRYDPRVQARLRGVFMTRAGRYLRMVWSGLYIDKEWKLDTSPWYNLFAIEIRLVPFTREEALRLIEEPVKGVYRYDTDAIELILQYSEYKPFRIQQICLATINRVLAQKRRRVTGPIRVTKEDVERAYRGLTAEETISKEAEVRGEVRLLEKKVAEGKVEYQVNTDGQGDQ